MTDEEAAAYGRFARVPARAEMERAFFLDDVEYWFSLPELPGRLRILCDPDAPDEEEDLYTVGRAKRASRWRYRGAP